MNEFLIYVVLIIHLSSAICIFIWVNEECDDSENIWQAALIGFLLFVFAPVCVGAMVLWTIKEIGNYYSGLKEKGNKRK